MPAPGCLASISGGAFVLRRCAMRLPSVLPLALSVVALAVPSRAEEWQAPPGDPAASLFDAQHAGASPAERQAFTEALAAKHGHAAVELLFAFLRAHPEERVAPETMARVLGSLRDEETAAHKRDLLV